MIMYNWGHMKQGHAGKGKGIFLRSVLAITMVAQNCSKRTRIQSFETSHFGTGGGRRVGGGWRLGLGTEGWGKGDNSIL